MRYFTAHVYTPNHFQKNETFSAPILYTSVTKAFTAYCKQIGIEVKSSHKARKTFVSTLLDADININSVRQFVGHKGIACEQNSSWTIIWNNGYYIFELMGNVDYDLLETMADSIV